MPQLLNFEPESVESARLRFPKAIDHIMDIKSPVPAGCQRRYVFDFEDGLTLIATKNIIAGMETVHISGSAFTNDGKQKFPTRALLRDIVKSRLRELWPYFTNSTLVIREGFMPSGSLHFDVPIVGVN